MASRTEKIFDQLSKSVAGSVSRRDALKMIGTVLVGGFFAPSALAHELIPEPSLADTCPSCGSCQTCNLDTTSCQPTCSPQCTTANLCNQAQTDPKYTQLQQYLLDQGFRFFGGEPKSIIVNSSQLETPRVVLTSVYVKRQGLSFSKPRLFDETATLFYTKGSPTATTGGASFIVEQFRLPMYGGIVNNLGLVELFPRISPTAGTQLTKTAGSFTAGLSRLGTKNIPDQLGGACNYLCNGTCAFGVELGSCVAFATSYCAPLAIPNPPGFILCGLAVALICAQAVDTFVCGPLCESFCGFCNTPNTGKISCGSQCCDPGYMCCRNECEPIGSCCPQGHVRCGSSCCPISPTLKCCGGACKHAEAFCPCGAVLTYCGDMCCPNASDICCAGRCERATTSCCIQRNGQRIPCAQPLVCCPNGDGCCDPRPPCPSGVRCGNNCCPTASDRCCGANICINTTTTCCTLQDGRVIACGLGLLCCPDGCCNPPAPCPSEVRCGLNCCPNASDICCANLCERATTSCCTLRDGRVIACPQPLLCTPDGCMDPPP